MLLLRNPIQAYAWGEPDGLAGLVGSPPTGGPEAELWVGTHPAAPSVVVDDPQGRTLAEVIAADPARWLGPELAAAGATALPFLLKVLSIGAPLSLQAHPSAEQAALGFAREEAAGIPLDAPTRTYRDANPKPEALVALHDTWLLCGFRDPLDVASDLVDLGITVLAPLIELLRGGPSATRDALTWLLHLTGTARHEVARQAEHAVGDADLTDLDRPATWVRRLAREHPGDPGCLAPFLLHLVHLAPGESVHLPAGNLHGYLHGAGVEIMAASDNVLRGGLTPKHIDVDELLAILRFTPGVPPAPVVRPAGPGLTVFQTGDAAFGLARVIPGSAGVSVVARAPSLLLPTGGPVTAERGGAVQTIDRGRALFLAPGSEAIHITGPGVLWWGTTGDGLPG